MYLLSNNNDTYTGMRLAGVEGEVLHTAEEFSSSFHRVCTAGEYAVILVTEKLFRLCADEIERAGDAEHAPLILKIPDRHGFGEGRTSITDYIKASMGFNVDENGRR